MPRRATAALPVLVLALAAPAATAGAPAVATFTDDAYRVGEAAGPATVTLTRTDPSGEASYSVRAAGAEPVAVTFAAGERTAFVRLPVADDAVDEADETVAVELLAGDTVLDTAQLTVVDDDPATVTETRTETVTVTETTPAPPAPPAPPRPAITVLPDTTAPVALVVAKDVRSRTIRANGVSVLYSCNEACRIRATLTVGGRAVGTGTTELRAPGVKRFRVRLSAAGRSIVRAGRPARVRLSARVADFRDNAQTTTSAFSVKR